MLDWVLVKCDAGSVDKGASFDAVMVHVNKNQELLLVLLDELLHGCYFWREQSINLLGLRQVQPVQVFADD